MIDEIIKNVVERLHVETIETLLYDAVLIYMPIKAMCWSFKRTDKQLEINEKALDNNKVLVELLKEYKVDN